MGYFSAQLDENNVVKAVTDTTGPLSGDNIISLQSYDISLVGTLYSGGSFVVIPPTQEQIYQQMVTAELNRINSIDNRTQAIANLIAIGDLPANYTE